MHIRKKLGVLIFLSLLCESWPVPSAADSNGPVQSIATTKVYFLKTRGPKKKRLICFLDLDKPTLGIAPKLSDSTVTYSLFKPKSKERQIALIALKECRKKLAAPACSDGCDNDADGSIDYPKDTQCSAATDTSEAALAAICSDGLDNDGDGKTDYPDDVGCNSKSDDDESDSTVLSAECSDGIDNDSDLKIDYPDDPGCQSRGDSDESNLSENLTPYSVFRKPFAGEYSIASMFDHQYPQEFVHVDGTVVTHSNDTTTIGVDGHQGYDYAMDQGTELLAAYDGTVVFAGTETPFFCPPLNKTVSGQSVVIRHQVQGEEYDSIYGHLSSIGVVNGQQLKKGDLIGLSGTTGCSTGPHLHFDIKRRTNTNDGKPSSTDPSGWIGTSPDPWESHVSGTKSLRLWAPGEAPKEYRTVTLAPNPEASNSAAVAIVTVRWAGPLDDSDPNNEYVELTIDPRFYPLPTYPLGGATLRNNRNEMYTFPQGFLLHSGQLLRVYSGSGIDSDDELYWGRTTGAWSNNGDCVHLIRPTGVTTYALFYGKVTCQTLGISAASKNNIVHASELQEMQAPEMR